MSPLTIRLRSKEGTSRISVTVETAGEDLAQLVRPFMPTGPHASRLFVSSTSRAGRASFRTSPSVLTALSLLTVLTWNTSDCRLARECRPGHRHHHAIECTRELGPALCARRALRPDDRRARLQVGSLLSSWPPSEEEVNIGAQRADDTPLGSTAAGMASSFSSSSRRVQAGAPISPPLSSRRR